MKKYDKTWQALNNLYAILYQSDAPKRFDEYYLDKFGNDAPGHLLRNEMKKLAKILDEADES